MSKAKQAEASKSILNEHFSLGMAKFSAYYIVAMIIIIIIKSIVL